MAAGTPVWWPTPLHGGRHPHMVAGTSQASRSGHSGREGAAPAPRRVPFPSAPRLSSALLRARHTAQTSCLAPALGIFWGESHVGGGGAGSEGCPCAGAGTFPPPRNRWRVPSLPPSRPSGRVTLRWLCSLAQLQSED